MIKHEFGSFLVNKFERDSSLVFSSRLSLFRFWELVVWIVGWILQFWQFLADCDLEVDSREVFLELEEGLDEPVGHHDAKVEDNAFAIGHRPHTFDALDDSWSPVSLKKAVGSFFVELLDLALLIVGLDHFKAHVAVGSSQDALLNFCWVEFLSLSSGRFRSVDIFVTWRLDPLHCDARQVFGPRKELLVLSVEESDASSRLSGTSCSASSMDVGLCIFWRLELDDEVDTKDIEASRSDVSSHNALEPACLEAVDGGLTRVLRDVSVHDLVVDLEGVSVAKLVRVLLRCCEDEDLACGASVDVD